MNGCCKDLFPVYDVVCVAILLHHKTSTSDFLTPSKCLAPQGLEMKELARVKMPQGNIDNLAALMSR